ncbi:hypothetical protein G6F40_015934 [Rhizopus arrhizus]|nr:hypothetical protein G6F40_015934 [Rhizopus arrhizus]
MHARGGEQVGIGARQDGGHRTARRQACHVDTLRVDRVRVDDGARHAGQYFRFAPTPLLMIVLEPVPAFLRIGLARLHGIQHIEALRSRGLVHGGAGSEIVGVLRATVKHDDQRTGLGARVGRHPRP